MPIICFIFSVIEVSEKSQTTILNPLVVLTVVRY